MTHQEIKVELIDTIIHQGQKISAQWDCGHDQSPVWFFINDKLLDYTHPLDDILEELRLIIIDKLLLPSGTNFSVKGDGVLGFDADESLFIEFDAVELNGVDNLVTWDGEKIINTSKYQDDMISLEQNIKLPFLIHKIKGRSIFIDFNIRDINNFEINISELSSEKQELLKIEVLKYEKDRLEAIFNSLDDDYVVEVYYSGKLFFNCLQILQINILHEKITQRWQKTKTILIP